MALFKPRPTAPRSVFEKVEHHMRAIRELFGDPKMTLVIRSDGLEKPIIFTNDEPDATIAAIREMTATVVTH
jgi:hypothetical protein